MSLRRDIYTILPRSEWNIYSFSSHNSTSAGWRIFCSATLLHQLPYNCSPRLQWQCLLTWQRLLQMQHSHVCLQSHSLAYQAHYPQLIPAAVSSAAPLKNLAAPVTSSTGQPTFDSEWAGKKFSETGNTGKLIIGKLSEFIGISMANCCTATVVYDRFRGVFGANSSKSNDFVAIQI